MEKPNITTIPQERIEMLEEEVNRIKVRYNPQSVGDLEEIARAEYGAEVIKTFLSAGVTCSYENKFYIFYYALFEPWAPLVLGHEIGHIAAGHFGSKLPLQSKQEEANYFSRLLNNISEEGYSSCFLEDFELKVKTLLSFRELLLRSSAKKQKKEIKRLKRLEVYPLLRGGIRYFTLT